MDAVAAMHNDETIWQCIMHDFCSFKVKIAQPKDTFCRNKYNVTGHCNRVSCPLANSQYATVLEEEGVCYLYIKTVERAHSPKNLWEKVKLSRNYLQALEQISKNLEYWPDHMINRCKQRLTKIRQMLIRSRKLFMKESGVRLLPIKHKTEKREKIREAKAEIAAKVDLAIEKELLARLKQGVYGDIYNVSNKAFEKVLEQEKEDESETEFVEDFGEEGEDEDLDDFDEAELDGEEPEDEKVEEIEYEELGGGVKDMEDLAGPSRGPAKRRRRDAPKVELEYEEEFETR